MRIILLALLVSLHGIGWGQTIVNSYHAVKSKGADNASLVVDDVTGLNEGDKVMIIQMKGGVTMNTSDNVDYGKITSTNNYGNVGKYEIATICKIDGAPINKIYLVNELANTYDYTNRGRIQVVRIAVYNTLNVSTSLEPTPWDSTSGKGGVLAIIVQDDLILSANVSANGKGFKGGKYVDSNDNCSSLGHTNYVYNPTNNPQNGAYKGESIYNILISQAGGKGANANGGGGGNNHNNGGGGGANLTFGGNGGGNYSVPDGWFGCINADPGFGGKPITVGSKDRIFLGGGGGAGQLNDALTPPVGGGSGGGIIFIQARNFYSNGYSISASGMQGGNQQGDGAAGGGAGGTIIMHVESFKDAIKIFADGGAGGNVYNESIEGNCYGAGGGGSGGAIYFRGTVPTNGSISVAGGVKGDTTGTKGCRSGMILAMAGAPGVIAGNYTYEVTGAIKCPEKSSLPVKILSFKVAHKGPHATAEWKVESPEDGLEYILQRRASNDFWRDIHIVPAEAQKVLYQKSDGPLATGIYLYRLKIVEKDRSVAYSPIQQITIKAEDVDRLMIHPNPATSEITIVSPVQNEEWLNIYDMKSRLVHRRKVAPNNAQIKQDISFLAEGVYMIQVGKYTARFVVFK